MEAADGPVVLLPGMNCSAALWAGLGLTGLGLTSLGLTSLGLASIAIPALTETTVAAQVEHLLDELPDRFALVGLSLGAVVAMALTRTAPERVDRLALMATNPRSPTQAWRESWGRQRDRLAAGTTPRDLQREALPLLLWPTTVRRRPEVVEAVLTMADHVGPEALDAQLQMQASRIDERPALTQVRCPTLVIGSRHDAMCGVDRHAEIAGLVPGARLIVLEEAGHLSPLERPEALSGLLQAWRTPVPAVHNAGTPEI